MQSHLVRLLAAAIVVVAATFTSVVPGTAWAARVGVLSNNYVGETATDFGANVPGHTFTPVDVSISVPTLASLTANFDVLLVFEDSTYVNATAVGNVVADFARTGRAVVLGTFYEQDRSDGSVTFTPHGWGSLETIDPNTSDGNGAAYSQRTLDPASIVSHPLTAGVTTLFSKGFAGGNQAKPATIVVANWLEKNALGNADPAIAYRITGAACVIHLGIAPNYPTIAAASGDFGGDFYRVWRNAFDFGAGHCVTGAGNSASALAIPTLSDVALALTALLIVVLAALPRVRARRR